MNICPQGNARTIQQPHSIYKKKPRLGCQDKCRSIAFKINQMEYPLDVFICVVLSITNCWAFMISNLRSSSKGTVSYATHQWLTCSGYQCTKCRRAYCKKNRSRFVIAQLTPRSIFDVSKKYHHWLSGMPFNDWNGSD